MKRKLLNCKDPVLKKKSEPVREINQQVKDLCFEMKEIMEQSQGIGLAAPQVGELKRIILIQTKDGIKFFINPEIIQKSDEVEFGEEGCLSLPGLTLKIKRPKEIKVRAMDLEGREVEIAAKDLTARIFQHEIDHLEGLLIFDRVGFWQKIKSKRMLNK